VLRHNLVVRLFLVLCAVAFVGTTAQARFLQTDPVGYKDDVNWYAYVQNDPTNKTDPTGMIGSYESTDPKKDPTSQLGAAQAKVSTEHPGVAAGMAVGALVLTGGVEVGVAFGGSTTVATTAAPVSGMAPGLAGKPDFVVTPEGTAMRPTPEGNRASLEGAGFPGRATTQSSESGTTHTVPGPGGKSTDIRIMDGGTGGPPRVVTTRAGTNDPVKPNGSQFPNGTPKQARRDGSHVDLGP
jgi:hypothetical protein